MKFSGVKVPEYKVKTITLEWDEAAKYVYMAIREKSGEFFEPNNASAIANEAILKIRRHLADKNTLSEGDFKDYASHPLLDGRWMGAINDAINHSSLADGK